jgi:hypothetical protein
MNIKKYKALVTIEKEIEIEVNLDIVNEEYLANFSSYMWGVDTVYEIVEHAASQAAHYEGSFIEGIGEYPNRWERDKNLADQGIHIVSIEEDTSVEID